MVTPQDIVKTEVEVEEEERASKWVNTKSHCFLCLEKASERKMICLQSLLRHLRINQEDVSMGGTSADIGDTEGWDNIEVDVCHSCGIRAGKLISLLSELEKVQNGIKELLEQTHKSISDSSKHPKRVEKFVKKMAKEDDLEIATNLRKQLLNKCVTVLQCSNSSGPTPSTPAAPTDQCAEIERANEPQPSTSTSASQGGLIGSPEVAHSTSTSRGRKKRVDKLISDFHVAMGWSPPLVQVSEDEDENELNRLEGSAVAESEPSSERPDGLQNGEEMSGAATSASDGTATTSSNGTGIVSAGAATSASDVAAIVSSDGTATAFCDGVAIDCSGGVAIDCSGGAAIDSSDGTATASSDGAEVNSILSPTPSGSTKTVLSKKKLSLAKTRPTEKGMLTRLQNSRQGGKTGKRGCKQKTSHDPGESILDTEAKSSACCSTSTPTELSERRKSLRKRKPSAGAVCNSHEETSDESSESELESETSETENAPEPKIRRGKDISNCCTKKAGSFWCKKCNRKYKVYSHAVRHYWASHLQKKFKCEICNEAEFSYQTSMIRHRRTCRQKLEKRRAQENDPRYIHVCEVCGKRFECGHELDIHRKRTHGSVNRYHCDLCDKKFTSRGYLNIHKNVHHFGKLLQCKLCKKQFASTATRWHHQKVCPKRPSNNK